MDAPGARTAWVRMYCSADRRMRVATFRLAAGEWQLAVVGEPEAAPEVVTGGGLPVAGRFGFAPGYPGCPGCGGDSYVRCGSCRQLGCWKSADPRFTCGNCGNSGPVSGSIDALGALDTG
ncbi:hypothetical protein [Actinoplanes sp. NPDC051851]|uniref:hypothetical protein n=1 Tax=Actinoplanes sp. NPDC051851 TaxID=3154753 RepID=UPI00342F0EF4